MCCIIIIRRLEVPRFGGVPMCGHVPEEGEVVDPSILLTSRQSKALAYGLRYGGKVLEEAVRKVPVAGVLVKIIV